MSVHVDIFDGTVRNEEKRIEYMNKKYDIIFNFNGNMVEQLDYIVKNQDTVIVTYLMDHPYYHHKPLLVDRKRHYVFCVDRHHVDYLKRYYKNITDGFFLPHGGYALDVENKSYQERSMDVVFLGSSGPLAEGDAFVSDLPPVFRNIISKVIQQMMSGNSRTFEDLVMESLLEKGVGLSEEDTAEIFSYLQQADYFIRSLSRIRLLEVLLEAGIVVDVFGEGWEEYESRFPDRLRLHGSISYKETLQVMGDSKIVLNAMPLFKDGAHDRIFNAMLAGAVCVTDGTPYLEDCFHDGEELRFYDLKNMDVLPGIVKELLDNPEKAEKIANRGYKKAMQFHTWNVRGRQFIELLKEL